MQAIIALSLLALRCQLSAATPFSTTLTFGGFVETNKIDQNTVCTFTVTSGYFAGTTKVVAPNTYTPSSAEISVCAAVDTDTTTFYTEANWNYFGTGNAYSGGVTTVDAATGTTYRGEWTQVQMAAPMVVTNLAISTRPATPGRITCTGWLFGSNDNGATNYLVGPFGYAGCASSLSARYPVAAINPTTTYTTYRLVSSSVAADNWYSLADLKLNGFASYPTGVFPTFMDFTNVVQSGLQASFRVTRGDFSGQAAAACSSLYALVSGQAVQNQVFLAFDGNAQTFYTSASSYYSSVGSYSSYTGGVTTVDAGGTGLYKGEWVQVTSPSSGMLTGFYIATWATAPKRIPCSGWVFGSNDGSSFRLISAFGSLSCPSSTDTSFSITSSSVYTIHRIVFKTLSSTVGSEFVTIAELRLSMTHAPTTQPTKQPSLMPTLQPTAGPATERSATFRMRNHDSFALVTSTGAVRTFGGRLHGGDSTAVASAIATNVNLIVASSEAYLAVKNDGSWAAWGDVASTALHKPSDATRGGVVPTAVAAAGHSFAAIAGTSRSVLAFGMGTAGGDVNNAASPYCDTTCVAALTTGGFVDVVATYGAYAAWRNDGSMVVWGSPYYGNNIPSATLALLTQLGVKSITASRESFAALTNANSVITWGNKYEGNSSSVVHDVSFGVKLVVGGNGVFVAHKLDYSIVVWGNPHTGGDASAVHAQLTFGVSYVKMTMAAVAAVKLDGSVVAWGRADAGGDASLVQSQLVNVKDIAATEMAFAALTAAGTVVAWGKREEGGYIPPTTIPLLNGVQAVRATTRAFAALKADGSVVVWGDSHYGGSLNTPSLVALLSSGVHTICSNDVAFAAIKTDGSVVAWGHSVSISTPGVQLTDSAGLRSATGIQCY